MSGMGSSPQDAETQLDAALDRAVEDSILLKAILQLEAKETLYFLNTPKGRAAAQAIAQGRWQPSGDEQMPIELALERPNIYRLYEQNIGPLTPLIADSLRDAESEYPDAWVQDAFRIAVENNVRNWRYIQAILNRWQEKGRDERQKQDRRDTEKDRRRYAEWEE
jgi:DnaD/phage-associated family protein